MLEEKLADLPLSGIRYFESVNSTNDVAADWSEKGALDNSMVIAERQTKGRGRSGRTWLTYPGSSLAFSLILRPSQREHEVFESLTTRFTGLGALGVCLTLQNHYDLPAEIKWPNDVLVNRRKLCGILAEAYWQGDHLSAVILGIGINIATSAIPPDHALIFPATSVEKELGYPVDRLSLLHQILVEITSWRLNLTDESFLQTWEVNLAYRGEKIQFVSPVDVGKTSAGLFEGNIIGLNIDGALRFRSLSGVEITFRSGEIPKTTDESLS